LTISLDKVPQKFKLYTTAKYARVFVFGKASIFNDVKYFQRLKILHSWIKNNNFNLSVGCREFINTHQNEARNRIIRMNLFMEMFTLGVTFAACASSIFGMNLDSRKLLQQPFKEYVSFLSGVLK